MKTSAQPVVCQTIAARRIGQWAANALIAGLWLWLYRPVLAYLGVVFSREQFFVPINSSCSSRPC